MSDEVEVVEVVETVDGEVVEAVVEVPTAVVQPLPGGWHLVTFGCWSVSISEEGQIRLPQAVSPESVGDLCGALSAAVEVSEKVIAENKAREAARSEASRRGIQSRGGVIVSDSGVPAGAMRIPVTSIPLRIDRNG